MMLKTLSSMPTATNGAAMRSSDCPLASRASISEPSDSFTITMNRATKNATGKARPR